MRFPAFPLALLAPLALAAASASAQETLVTAAFDQNENLGWAITELGDLNGDGIPEVGVGAPAHRPNAPGGLDIGRALILDGASLVTGSAVPLYDIVGPTMSQGCAGASGSSFGGAIAGGRDINADGTPDFVISASLIGAVIPFDGATGMPLLPPLESIDGPCTRRHGSALQLLDADGDQYADLLVTQAAESTVFPSRYIVYSGAWLQNPSSTAQKQLYSGQSSIVLDLMGRNAAVLGDIDGDGRDDFALSAGRVNGSAFPDGSIVVVSGASGAMITRFGPASGGSGFGDSIAAVPDRNGDGMSELAVMQRRWPNTSSSLGRVEIVSGSWMGSGGAGVRTVEFITLDGVPQATQFGTALSSMDVNSDGVADILASYRGTSTMEWAAISGRTGDLMWTRGSSQAQDSLYPTSSALVDLGGTRVAILGLPGTPNVGAPLAGEVIVARAHDGAGLRDTLGVNCPCGADDPGAGCPNTTGQGGRLAVESGSASLGSQALRLTATDLPPFSFGILVGGVPAAPMLVNGGLLGVGQAIRGSVAQANGAGRATYTGDLFGQFAAASSTTPGTMAPMVGVPFAFQLWYRSFSCAGSTNFTNSYVLTPRL